MRRRTAARPRRVRLGLHASADDAGLAARWTRQVLDGQADRGAAPTRFMPGLCGRYEELLGRAEWPAAGPGTRAAGPPARRSLAVVAVAALSALEAAPDPRPPARTRPRQLP